MPFMVRYRKEMINHMDADAVRDVQMVYEELWYANETPLKKHLKETNLISSCRHLSNTIYTAGVVKCVPICVSIGH